MMPIQQRGSVNTLTEAERKVISELEFIRDQLGWSDARFVRLMLKQYSYSVWIRVRKDYYTGDTRAVLKYYAGQLEHARGAWRRDQVSRPNLDDDEPFFMTENARAVLAAIDIASRRKNEKGLVMFVAPPGGGKSSFLRYLRRTHGARITQATRAWKNAYGAGLNAVGAALGVAETFHTTFQLESAVFQAARELGHAILCIDDANTFGVHTCDMVRDLCNLTNLTVVTASTSIPFINQNVSGYNEGEQMRRRAVAIIKANRITTADVRQFFAQLPGINEQAETAFQAVADAANMYNKFDFVQSVVASLKLRYQGEPITLSQVQKSIGIEAKKLQRDKVL